MKKTIFTFIVLSAFLSAKAEILMPKVFSDNMVLQRDVPVKIWGKADANAKVKVEFAGQIKEATASSEGDWSLNLEPMKANAQNQNMKISENGSFAKEIKDLLVGEVWIAGGQSNMVRSVAVAKHIKTIGNRAENSLMRMFSQEIHLMKGYNPLTDKEDLTPNFDSPEGAKWNLATMNTTGDFGAICFFFAERLITELKVPVGIIQTPLGGSNMVSWVAREDLAGVKTFETALAEFDAVLEAAANSKSAKATRGNKGLGFYRSSPSFLYNTKIAPVAGYTARGFIWYQGEADSGNPEFADMYARVINSWRKYWGTYYELDDGKLEVENMPFYGIQLASFEDKTDWAATRWAQYLVSEKLDDVEILINIDTGMETNIHPLDKDIVGTRLANLVLGETYDLKAFDDYSFPLLDEVEYEGSQVEVEFDTDTKLKLVGDFRGFEIFVANKWEKAILVEIKKDKIILKSGNNGTIDGVRYLWKNWAKPDACLYNELDLPAMSFIDMRKL